MISEHVDEFLCILIDLVRSELPGGGRENLQKKL